MSQKFNHKTKNEREINVGKYIQKADIQNTCLEHTIKNEINGNDNKRYKDDIGTHFQTMQDINLKILKNYFF